jgi:subtilase family serine protease
MEREFTLHFRYALAAACLCALTACGGAQQTLIPQQSSARSGSDTAQALPGDTAQALPGDTAQALPGDTAQALPGAQLACQLPFQSGSANCTVAINMQIPSISDVTTPANLLPGLHPADLQNAYGLSALGSTATVAIVDAYDDPAAESDLAIYRAAFGLPACTSSNGCFTKVNQQGQSSGYPSVNLGWDQEISLDLDMVSAICPQCNILLVEANSNSLDDLGAAVDTSARLHAIAVSNSYYAPEYSGETVEDAHYNHPGIAITVSAGDQRSTFYPAASPYVTSVGGTSLSGSPNNWTENPWLSSGGGCSLYESRPQWQKDSGCSNQRATVDVAAVADPNTGVAMYDSTSGGWLVAGGTSVGAPIVAAAYALSANPQSPAFSYEHSSAFRPVGSAGYNLVAGLGAPAGVGGL